MDTGRPETLDRDLVEELNLIHLPLLKEWLNHIPAHLGDEARIDDNSLIVSVLEYLADELDDCLELVHVELGET